MLFCMQILKFLMWNYFDQRFYPISDLNFITLSQDWRRNVYFGDLKGESPCLMYKHIDEETWDLFKESRENEAWMVNEVT